MNSMVQTFSWQGCSLSINHLNPRIEVEYRVHETRLLDAILSQLNPVHVPIPISNIRCDNIPHGYFLTKILYASLTSAMRTTFSVLLFPFGFIVLLIFHEIQIAFVFVVKFRASSCCLYGWDGRGMYQARWKHA